MMRIGAIVVLVLAALQSNASEITPEEYFQQAIEVLQKMPGDRRVHIIFYGYKDPSVTSQEVATMKRVNHLLQYAAAGGVVEAQFLYATTGALEYSDYDQRMKPLTDENGKILFDRDGRSRMGGAQAREHEEQWLRVAAANDHPNANYYLGRSALLENASGPYLDREERLPFLERAAELGVAEAVERLAAWREAERKREALHAHEGEYSAEQLYLLYEERVSAGYYGENKAKAKMYLQQAADKGHARAQFFMARDTWSEDRDLSAHYYKMLHDAGDAEATYALGTYEACRGDEGQARAFYEEAVRRGHEGAPYALRDIDAYGIEEWTCSRPY